jgi:hypothetical protein
VSFFPFILLSSALVEHKMVAKHLLVALGVLLVERASGDSATEQIVLMNANTGLCLDVPGFTAATSSTQERACTGAITQRWYYDSTSKALKNAFSNRCLDAANAGRAGTIVNQNSCGGTRQQQWLQSGFRWIVSYNTSLCLSGGGTTCTVQGCNASPAQTWYPRNLDLFNLIDGSSGLCVETTSNARTDGTVLTENTCSGSANQKYQFDDFSRLINAFSGKCLTANSDNTVVLGTCGTALTQVWDVDSSYRFSSRSNSTLCMTGKSTGLYLSTCAPNTSNQVWDISRQLSDRN